MTFTAEPDVHPRRTDRKPCPSLRRQRPDAAPSSGFAVVAAARHAAGTTTTTERLMTLVDAAVALVLPVRVPGDPPRDRLDRLLLDRRSRASPRSPCVGPSQATSPLWRCKECGPQPEAECLHTFSAALVLAAELLGLTPAVAAAHTTSTEGSTGMSTIASRVTEGPLVDALNATSPAWTDARRRLDRLEGLTLPAMATISAQEFAGDVLESALANPGSKTAPDKLAEQVGLQLRREEGANLLHHAARERRRELKTELDNAMLTDVSEVLCHLSGQLVAVVTEAREVFAELGHVRSTDDALAAELVPTWQRLPRLEDALCPAAQRPIGRVVACHRRAAQPRHLSACQPEQPGGPRRRNARTSTRPHGAHRGRQGTPAARSGWPAWHAPEALAWFADHLDAVPWIPTAAEIRDAERGHRPSGTGPRRDAQPDHPPARTGSLRSA